MSGVPYHAWTHAPKAEGGTDPIAVSAGTSAALLNDLDFENAGDENVAANNWEEITDGANGRFFLEGWRLDADWGVFADGAGPGNFQRTEFALYESWASVDFGNAANGDTIGVAIQFASSATFVYNNSLVVVDNEQRVTVAAHWWGNLLDPVRYYCYTSAARALTRCELFIRRFELNDSGEYLDFS